MEPGTNWSMSWAAGCTPQLHGTIDGKAQEKKVNKKKECSYLIRPRVAESIFVVADHNLSHQIC